MERLDARINPAAPGGLISQGHIDFFEMAVEDGQLELGSHNEEIDQELTPEGTFLVLKPESRVARPAGTAFDFIGAAEGEQIHLISQVEDVNLLFGGTAAEEIEPGTFPEYLETDPRVNTTGEFLQTRLIGVEGPGDVSVWANDPFGGPVVYFATSDGVDADDVIFTQAGGHVDYNFAFSRPGEYRVTVQAVAFAGPNKTQPIFSEETTYTFFAQQAAGELPPSFVPPPAPVIAAGLDAGGEPRVNVYDAATGDRTLSFLAFDASFTGGVRTATGDFNGDGVFDVVAAGGPGARPEVRMFDGKTGGQIGNFLAFEETFTGGLFVAAGDFDGDGTPDVVVSPDRGGGPRVRVVDGGAPSVTIADFFAIDDKAFRGGARASVGDINADGIDDLFVGAGFGGGPRVAAFDGTSLATAPVKLFDDFFVFEQTLRNGVFTAVGDLDADARGELIVGGGPGGAPRVYALSGKSIVEGGEQVPVANFFAGDQSERGGVRVAAMRVAGNDFTRSVDIVTGAGPGAESAVRTFASEGLTPNGTPTELRGFDAFAGERFGVFVG